MNRSIWVYGGLLAGLLFTSYLRWTGVLGKQQDSKDIVIFPAEKAEIEKVAYHDEKVDVVLEVRKDALGEYAWVDLTERKTKKKTDAKEEEPATPEGEAPAPEAAAEEVETTRQSFKGGDAADKMLASLAPLKAISSLEQMTDDKKTELELATPKAWIEITRKGRTRKLELGGESYGTKDRYVHDTETNRYYLVKADTIRPLSYAKTRLPDRRLLGIEAKDVVRAHLEGPTGAVEMLHQNREDDKAAYWANPSNPAVKVEIYDNWLDKALKLRGLNYVQADETTGDLTPVFKLTLVGSADKKETLEVLQATNDKGETEFYARSEFTRGLMNLHKSLAQESAEDVQAVIEARPSEAPAASEAAPASSEPDKTVEPPKAPVPLPGLPDRRVVPAPGQPAKATP